ncbi:3-hydroxyacyl-ACP dehydratase FabZ family protein [Prosthecobacter sp. SYSU 5D2]|uniref:3-hydroxyacyl-ACP dehydratase FabZ family protein n=1 Tax=Prosthecobacter sp. SYSU 5D2 TaxID=3134134 RepID=UPI0031FF1506
MLQPAPLVQALSSLPHGPAFRFIDEIISMDPGVSATARWTLKGDEAFLEGHFPGRPLLPGVIMIESLAQLGGILAQSDRGENPLKNVRLTAVRQFKILGSIPPGETLTISAKRDAVMPGLVQVSGEILTSTGTRLATGSIILSGEE